jgi:hypothetical protein
VTTDPSCHDTERAVELAGELSAAAQRFAAIVDDLAAVAADLVRLEGERWAALTRAGIDCRRPPMREVCIDLLHGRLEAMRPFLPFVSAEATERAGQALQLPCAGLPVGGDPAAS